MQKLDSATSTELNGYDNVRRPEVRWETGQKRIPSITAENSGNGRFEITM